MIYSLNPRGNTMDWDTEYQTYPLDKDKAEKAISDHISNAEKNLPALKNAKWSPLRFTATATGAGVATIGLILNFPADEKIALMAGWAALGIVASEYFLLKYENEYRDAKKLFQEAQAFRREITNSKDVKIEYPDNIEAFLRSRIEDKNYQLTLSKDIKGHIRRGLIAVFGAATLGVYGMHRQSLDETAAPISLEATTRNESTGRIGNRILANGGGR